MYYHNATGAATNKLSRQGYEMRRNAGFWCSPTFYFAVKLKYPEPQLLEELHVWHGDCEIFWVKTASK